MTPAQFRRLALRLPGVCENAHMDHPDFRVGGKIFATLGYPDDEHAMVILSPQEQARLIREHSKVLSAANGAWGKRGSTVVRLKNADSAIIQAALKIGWRFRQLSKRSADAGALRRNPTRLKRAVPRGS